MDKDRLMKMAGNPDFIPGIFNYCDRWCERCSYTSRCLLFATEREMFPESVPSDTSKEKFWDALHRSFQLTIEMVHDYADRQGIDLSAIDVTEEIEKIELDRKAVESHPLVQAARSYAEMASHWLAQNLQSSEATNTRVLIISQHDSGDSHSAAAEIRDAVEVISWYLHFIQVKLMRSLGGEEFQDDDDLEAYPSDSDGSAKVALIAIDRSIGAWGTLLRHFGAQEDRLMGILLLLSKLRTDVEEQFKKARFFVRPGFDQEV